MINFESGIAEKIELAKKMRAKSVFQSNTPEDLALIYQQTKKETRLIPTREGKTKIYLYHPQKKDANTPCYINFHGGGFVRQWRENDAIFCCALVSRLGCLVIDVDYRLAPEYPFPTAVYESYDAVKWVFEHADELGIDSENIAVGGHSAGAHLAATISMIALASKNFHLKYAMIDYPGFSFYKEAEEYETIEGAIPPERCMQFTYLNFTRKEDTLSHIASPVLADQKELEGFEPCCIITAEKDSMKEDGQRFADKLIEAGTPVLRRHFLHSRHGFLINFTDEYEEALSFYANTLQNAFAAKVD